MFEKCHHFTLTYALVTIQTINLSVPDSELKKEMNGRGRHLEQKIWFLTINQVQPTLFLQKLSLIKVKEELVTETNEDNDFNTMIPIGFILCFIEHLYYQMGHAAEI